MNPLSYVLQVISQITGIFVILAIVIILIRAFRFRKIKTVKFFRLPGSTKKSVSYYFDGLNPNQWYKPSEELGNYQWCFFSQKVAGVEGTKRVLKKMDPKIVELIPKLIIDTSTVISYKEFRSFLIMNYKGWAPYAKGMNEKKAAQYSDMLIKSFLSCSPKKAVYLKYDHINQDSSCLVEFKSHDRPMMISGVVGVLDGKNMEYFKLVMGGYDSHNKNCLGAISPVGLPEIKFCPIRKIPIEFDGFDPSLINQGYTEELGNYGWYLYQFRLNEGGITIEQLQKNELFRTSVPPVGKLKSSLVVSNKEFRSFLIMNYKGWAPYAKGMSEKKAAEYSDKLIKSFLACTPEEALYFKCEGWQEIENPYLISGVMCIWDQQNNEFFELIMGGTD